MANLNVLPQVNAKPSGPVSGSKGEVSKDSAKGAELSKDFQKSLTQAASEKSAGQTKENPAGLNKTAQQASEKDAAEKAAALALQASMANVPQTVVPAKGAAAQADPEALKGGSPLNAKGEAVKGDVIPLKGQALSQQLLQKIQVNALQAQQLTPAQLKQLQEQAPKEIKGENLIQTQGEQSPMAAMNLVNGLSLSQLSDEHAFDVESLDVKDGSSFSDQATELKNGVPSSKLSTSDYLNLRDLSQNSAKSGLDKNAMKSDAISMQNPNLQSAKLESLTSSGVGMKAVTLGKDNRKNLHEAEATAGSQFMGPDRSLNGVGAKTVEAPVTTGSNQNLVLSHDAVHQLSNQVNLMAQAKQDGEIKIRLKPDHLGELSMSVRTQGGSVSIQIKAQDNEAKKIIEESLGSLRDSLSQQNLTLGRVDVVTQAPQAQADTPMQMDLGQFRQNHDQSSFNGNGAEQNTRQERAFEDSAKTVNLNAGRMTSQLSAIRSRAGSANGLDMIA